MKSKPDIMDAAPVFDNKWDTFKYWFTNVYWFHYRWHTIGGVIGAALLISIITTVVTNKAPDLTIIMCGEVYFDHEYVEKKLKPELEELVGEYLKKENVYVEIVTIAIDYESEAGMMGPQILAANMARSEAMLVIMEKLMFDGMFDLDRDLQNLEQYGLGDNYYIDMSNAPRILQLIWGMESNLYAGMMNRNPDNKHPYLNELSAIALKYLYADD